MYNVGKDYYSDIGREEQSICEDCDKYNGTLQYSQLYDHLLNNNKVHKLWLSIYIYISAYYNVIIHNQVWEKGLIYT